MWNKEHRTELQRRRDCMAQGGGASKIEKQHQKGKLTARERIALLLDENSFCEIGGMIKTTEPTEFFGDGVVTGFGTINGRKVFVSSQDFTYHGGTLGEACARKICNIMDMAIENKCPYIAINDSGGARIEEGVSSLSGYAGILKRNMKASGIIPQISIVLGPCAGGACYSPAICDFIFMSKNNSQMFITGPDVVKSVTGESTTVDQLGGAEVHSKISGVAHFVYDSDHTCIAAVREFLDYLPSSCCQLPPCLHSEGIDETDRIENIVPDQIRKAYDVKEVIATFVDPGSFWEVSRDFARNVVVGFAGIDGDVVGIVANQPLVLAGVLDSDASDKAARFVRFCDCFNIPLIALADVPGYLPGETQEHSGIIRHGAKLLYAFAEATVPKITLIMRKAYGGAFIAMNSKGLGADFVFSWPIAQAAVMGAEGAVDIINRREIKEAENPTEKRDALIEEYSKEFLNPYIAAERGYIDEVIFPEETKLKITQALSALAHTKYHTLQRKHGNIPL